MGLAPEYRSQGGKIIEQKLTNLNKKERKIFKNYTKLQRNCETVNLSKIQKGGKKKDHKIIMENNFMFGYATSLSTHRHRLKVKLMKINHLSFLSNTVCIRKAN
jgi:hypothetical protein